MIDHFLGNINLSRVELAVLALKCLFNRKTTEYLPGDQAYALMSLLRQRPQIDRTDTAFQAFSRLFLANDSDRLLERYIALCSCTSINPGMIWTTHTSHPCGTSTRTVKSQVSPPMTRSLSTAPGECQSGGSPSTRSTGQAVPVEVLFLRRGFSNGTTLSSSSRVPSWVAALAAGSSR